MNFYKNGMEADPFPDLQIAKDNTQECGWVVIQKNKKRRIRIEYNPKPYYFVYLRTKYGRAEPYQLARVIYTCYLHRAIPPRYVIDHIDENSLNNDTKNLQCIYSGDNVRKSAAIKRKQKTQNDLFISAFLKKN